MAALSAITATSSLADVDLFYVLDGANSRKITYANVKTQLGSATITLTNKTLALGSNTFSGTKAQFTTAVTDGTPLFQGDTITSGVWNGTDIAVADGGTGAGTAAAARTNLGLVIGADVQAFDADILKADTADVLTAGFGTTAHDDGTKSSGTFTPDEADGNIQYAVNGGAHTLAPPTNNCTVIVHYTNNGSAGAITTSGFTLVDGDSFTTTNTEEFLCYLTKANDVSHLTVKALQ